MSILDKYQKAYFSGIGGIGVSALARLFFHSNINVEGSDLAISTIVKDLEKVGIKINQQQIAENITTDIDVFIHSAALTNDNPELVRAKELKIETYSYFEFLGLLSKEYETIAISGTHGKSTTTAMLGLILIEAGLDPTVILGTQVKGFDHNFRAGHGKYLVLESCEYRGHMLNIESQYSLVNNVEADHLDFYRDLDEIVSYFSKFLGQAKKLRFINLDDPKLAEISEYNPEYITFGIENQQANFLAKNIKTENNLQTFDLYFKGGEEGQLELQIPGEFNIYNALGAIAIASTLGVDFKAIKTALKNFSGCWRRFEIVGKNKETEALIISDYAHHPTAIKKTIKAAKEFYPDKKILVAFEPHQHSRTEKLFDDFVGAFDLADNIILNEIYDVKGRETEIKKVSSKDLLKAIIKKNPERKDTISYASNLETTRRKILELATADTIVLVMGAGDIDKVARQLVN
ncbi:MAG: UDP-N-acetylmuramate--L-alanine ligase [Patescibacteria group bacterium]